MKHLRRSLSLLIVLLMIASVLSAGGVAETVSQIVALKTGSWFSVIRHANQMPAYKLTLSEDSIVKVEWKNATRKSLYSWIYNNKSCTGTNMYCLNGTGTESGTREYAFAKGTYYLQIYDYFDNSQMRFTLSSVKKTGVSNYCVATAKSLSANKTVLIAQSPNYSHCRWFKIKLSKSKKFYATVDPASTAVTLYDASLDTVACTSSSGTIQSKEKLPKGTYYIRISENLISSKRIIHGRVFRLKWK